MKRSRSACALIAAATIFSMSGSALAAPTQADFDACNREAQAGGQNPAASPRSGTSAPTSSSTSSGSGTMSSGTSGSTGSAGGSMSSGSTSSDAALQGMAAAGAGDQTYQQAYRDCMKRRGF